jgi:hypothetical protein
MAITRIKTSGIYGAKYIDALAGLPAVMAAPTATATGATTATVAFTTQSGATSYTAISNPGNLTGTGASSPITVSGLTGSTSYTFRIAATNAQGTGGYSSASNQITTLPPFTAQLAYDSIASSTNPGSSSVTFSSIPQTYAHLEIIAYTKITSTSTTFEPLYLQFNGDTGATNYITTGFGANYGSTASLQVDQQDSKISGNNYTPTSRTAGPNWTGTYGYTVYRITDYQKTDRWKSVNAYNGYVSNQSGYNGFVNYLSGTWKNTGGITSVTVFLDGTFASGTDIRLYGIKQGL